MQQPPIPPLDPKLKWQVYRLDNAGTIINMNEWNRPDWAKKDAEELAFKWRGRGNVFLVHPNGKQDYVKVEVSWQEITPLPPAPAPQFQPRR